MKLAIFCHCPAIFTALGTFGLSAGILAVDAHGAAVAETPQTAASASVLARKFGQLPMSFEPNQGQTDARVQFLSRGRGYALLLTSHEAVFSLRDGGNGRHSRSKPAQAAIRMALQGATPHVRAQGLDPLEGTVNYFVGNDPAKWHSGITTYRKVKYPGIYPGIDLIYYGNQQELEFDFIVAPGADPQNIRLSFEGADKLKVAAQGELLLHLGDRVIQWHKPLVYQESDGGREEIPCRYVLKGPNEVAFDVGAYAPNQPLIIDPVIVYSTFLGGRDFDRAEAIAVNLTGSPFVCGETISPNFPTRFAYDSTLNGSSNDVFVTKLGAAGTAAAFSTYIGGTGDDAGLAIAVDRNNLVYVTGQTSSGNFPRMNAFQSTLSGQLDAFVLKLGASGTNLLYSTFFGGGGFESGNGIAVDAVGNAYVVGETDSGDTGSQKFPEKNAFQGSPGGFLDAFVARFNTALSSSASLIYASWLGGPDDERAKGVVLDSATNVYLCGEIFTPDVDVSSFPTTLNAFQSNFGGGFNDGFVTKLSAGPSPGILFSTFLGGASEDFANALALDSSNNIYVTGSTSSTNFPRLNAMQPVIGGEESFFTFDAFATKLNSAGNTLLYSTFLGGELDESGNGIAVDVLGTIYVAGSTTSDDFPVTLGADQPVFGITGQGTSDGFVSRFTTAVASPSALIYSTFLGGSEGDLVTGLAVDATDSIYVTGHTSSTNLPTTAGTLQRTNAGGFDAFITKYSSATDLSLATTGSAPAVILGSNVTFTIRVNNNSRSQFSGVALTNRLPPGLEHVTNSTTRGNCTYNPANTTLSCNFGIMPSNSSATVTLVARTRIDGLITNVLRLTAIEAENNRGNNTNYVVTTVRSTPDLTLTQTASPDPVLVGSDLTYRLEVRNKGPGLARSLMLTNRFPASAGLLQGAPVGCFAVSNTVICALNDLPEGASNIITIVVTNRTTGTITNTANVATSDFDPVPDNNIAVITTRVVTQADVVLTVAGSPDPITVSNQLSYLITVNNRGPSTATGLVVTNILPGGVSYVSHTTTHGSCSVAGGRVICNISSLPADDRAMINIIVFPPAMAGMLTNFARVILATPDPNTNNNQQTFVSRVSTLPAIALRHVSTNAIISWPTSTGPFRLESAASLNPPITWQQVTNVPAVISGQNTVTQRISDPTRFYRLIR